MAGPYREVVQQALERLYGRPLTVRAQIASTKQDADLTMQEAADYLGLSCSLARKYIPRVDCTVLRKKYSGLGQQYRLAVSEKWLTENKQRVLDARAADEARRLRRAKEIIAQAHPLMREAPETKVAVEQPKPVKRTFWQRLFRRVHEHPTSEQHG